MVKSTGANWKAFQSVPMRNGKLAVKLIALESGRRVTPRASQLLAVTVA